MLSFDLHPSWWFGRKMDDSDYEWRYWVDYYGTNIQWYIGHAFLGLTVNTHLQKVSNKYYPSSTLFGYFCFFKGHNTRAKVAG